ncbi:MAG TPA: 50S ribosomal protein L25 [Candidatus Omnitrophota bacterium]|nr:50S ribosomal protein L25 [Candidatus Omnitrophota bacterium]HPT07212.1 50S ribosomal protein L25 [Candidatus Omnitrophota bacterium]
MEEIILNAQTRAETGRGKVKDLRDGGFLPCVVYGEGEKAQAILVNNGEFLHMIHEHKIENAILTLKVKDDKKKSRSCLIKDVQYDPVRGTIIHVDFHEISLTKAIKVNVQVVAKGESVGVKQDGGALEHVQWEIEVECLPTNIPQSLEVDISALKIGDSIHVKDIVVPEGVKIITDPDTVVLTIAAPMKEEVPAEAVEGEEKKEPEVIKEKKEVPGEGEAAPEAKEKK